MITEFTERGNKLGVALASRYPPPSFERTQDRLSPRSAGEEQGAGLERSAAVELLERFELSTTPILVRLLDSRSDFRILN